jgi:hypothetical protein
LPKDPATSTAALNRSSDGPAAASVAPSPTFEALATAVAVELRTALGKVLDRIPGAPSRPLDVAEALSIDMNLAWKVCKVVGAADPFAALQHLPGDTAMQIFLKAAAKAGVEPAVSTRVEAALGHYQQLRTDHAGSRVVLDSLLGHLASAGATRADLTARRNAFRSMSSLVGVRADAQIVTYLFSPTPDAGPSPDPLHTRAAIIRGYVGLRRLRADLSWVIGFGRRISNSGEGARANTSQPIDPEAAARYGGVPILSAGGSPHGWMQDAVVRSSLPDGSVVDRVQGGPIGRQGEMTFFMGETLTPALPSVVDDRQSHLRLVASAHTPSECLVFDLLFHRRLPPLGDCELSLFTTLGGMTVGMADPRDCISLTLCESIEPRGAGLAGLRLEESPDYLETLELTCGTLGINPADLETFRVRIKHPPVPCSAMVQRRMLW